MSHSDSKLGYIFATHPVQMVILRKLIDITQVLIHQKEANELHFHIIMCLDHLGGWAPHNMTKTAKFDQNWLSNALLHQFFPEFRKSVRYLKSKFTAASEECGERNFETEYKKGSPTAQAAERPDSAARIQTGSWAASFLISSVNVSVVLELKDSMLNFHQWQ